MEYATLASQNGYQEGLTDAVDPTRHHFKSHSSSGMSDQSKGTYYGANANPHPHHISCDIKPRLTKEQHDILEAHYQTQPKPSTNTKKSFAESLNVSLDKVNNWFQNRRAKSKQDAKKQAGAFNLFQSQQSAASVNFGSDSETSPSFTSPDYFNMMQQFADDTAVSGQGMMQQQQQQQHFQEHGLPHGFTYSNNNSSLEDFSQLPNTQQGQGDPFDSPQEINRRTLTQDQFDAFTAMQGNMLPTHHEYPVDGIMFSPDQDVYQPVFPDLSNGQIKDQDAFAFPHPLSAPIMTGSDSSGYPFPSSHAMQEQANMSSTSSEWTGSRTSSVSDLHEVATQQQFQHQPTQQPPQPQPITTASQWQPGQSVPVNIEDLSAQFRQAAQARQSPPRQVQQPQPEQPLAWPADEAFLRRDSSTTALAQQMGHVGLTTPQPQQQATFKTPGPASSIAARRQRPRPAALGLVNARSQSYSGGMQPASPGQAPHSASMAPNQQLRRIKSSNVVNGIAHGRVQKSLPGSAQRSPMSFTFAEAMQSPKLARHASSQNISNLAPPTPLSPSQHPQQDQQGHFSQWQAKSGPITRQPSISELPDENCQSGQAFVSCAPAPPQQSFSSPPHTPMFQGHPQFAPPPLPTGNAVITENTPPQSAPATQQCFPINQFAASQQDMHSVQMPGHVGPQQQQHALLYMPPQSDLQAQQQMQQQMPAYPQVQPQPFPVQTPLEAPMQFPQGGVPMVNGNGDLQLIFPQQFQFVQHQPQGPQPQPGQPIQQPIHTPPQLQHQFGPSIPSPGNMVMPHHQKPSQPAAELFVHEYNPPGEVKRTGTPRKVVDNGPKNYTFANQGPEHFEKKNRDELAKAKASGTSSNSPDSSAGGSS